MKRKPTGDLALIKKMNTAIVLDAIRKSAPLSRAKISEQTGLNKATVSSLVQDLIDHHLAFESGTGASSGGRKPVMLLFNEQAGHAIGIDLGVNYIRGVLVDLKGGIIAEKQLELHEQAFEAVWKKLVSCVEELMDQAPSSPYGIIGIGVGVPGIVNETGTILLAPNLGWEHIPLQELLAKRFSLPVTIDNEANMGALGEYRYGAGKGASHQIYVSVGIGIGTGIILDKSLYKGASGFSGELGHMSIAYDGRMGEHAKLPGAWELYASEQALLRQSVSLGYGTLEEVLGAAEAGDTKIHELLAGIGSFLGIGISNIVNIFNPELVIIGNRMRLASTWLQPTMMEAIHTRSMPFHREGLRILFADLQEQSAVRGAASCAINNFLRSIKAGEI